MRVLTLFQPWAALMAHGAKQIETRSWRTPYRGLVAIHAAVDNRYVVPTIYENATIAGALFDLGYLTRRGEQIFWTEQLTFGHIVAVGTLTDVRLMRGIDMDTIHTSERAFGHWSPERYAWFFEDVRRLAQPIPYKGSQGLRDLDETQVPLDEVLRRAFIVSEGGHDGT